MIGHKKQKITIITQIFNELMYYKLTKQTTKCQIGI